MTLLHYLPTVLAAVFPSSLLVSFWSLNHSEINCACMTATMKRSLPSILNSVVRRVRPNGSADVCRGPVHLSNRPGFVSPTGLLVPSVYGNDQKAHISSSAQTAKKPRSPYAVLQLRTSASKKDIKAAFRRLAKIYHPDLNTTHSRSESEERMAEIIDACDQLMDDDFGGRIGDSRVALACEMYTIPELRIDRLHEVYSLKVKLIDDSIAVPHNVDAKHSVQDIPCSKNEKLTSTDVSTHSLIEIEAHPHDSVSDLKRHIQSIFQTEWGLSDRRLDRDGIATGWELVNDIDGSILSYHLFLSSYGIKDGDIIHAVVRKYNEVEREAST